MEYSNDYVVAHLWRDVKVFDKHCRIDHFFSFVYMWLIFVFSIFLCYRVPHGSLGVFAKCVIL